MIGDSYTLRDMRFFHDKRQTHIKTHESLSSIETATPFEILRVFMIRGSIILRDMRVFYDMRHLNIERRESL